MTRSLAAAVVLVASVVGSASAEVTIAFIADSFSDATAPALAAVRARAPDGIVVMGDFPHANPGANSSNAAGFLAKARAMWTGLFEGTTPLGADFKAQLLDPGLPVLLTVLDDHDAARDNVTATFPYWPQVLDAFLERHAVPPDNGFALGYQYQATTLGPVRLIALDLRSHRVTAPAAKKTLLGAEQKAWLAAEMTAAAADPGIDWVVLVSTVPLNPHQAKLDSWSGFHADRDWLHAQIAASGLPRVLVVSADCHWGSIALPPLVALPELNIPQLNAGFSNTCNNAPSQWSLNSTQAGTGFGLLTLGPDGARLDIHHADGGLRLGTILTVP